MRICVFCAASTQVNEEYLNAAYKLGQVIAANNAEIIYGGGNIGLMGKVADGALSEKGTVIGVIPTFLNILELGHNGIKEIREVEDMHRREAAMMLEADCIVALPGGCGTFSEILQSIAWKYLGLITCPIVFVNIRNYYDPLLEMLRKSRDENFFRIDRDFWQVFSTVEETADYLKSLKKFTKKEHLQS